MTNEQMKKAEFVKNDLLALLQVTETDVKDLEYNIVNNNEIVTVTYRNDYQRKVNVNCDSLRAIAMDVLRKLD